MTRVAAIDCGTNSIRLLVADVDPDAGTLRDVDRSMRIVRLGEGVDGTGHLAADALARTLDALRQYAQRIEELGAGAVRMVATSATRDADNRAEFVDGVRGVLGIEPEVVTGDEEARLSFAGATRELDPGDGPFLVVDIGGGSTELVFGLDGHLAARSVDVGCVRLTERHLHDDPPSPDQVAAAVRDVRAALDDVARDVPYDRARTLVGLAGSVTTVTAHALGLPEYQAERIHLARLPTEVVVRACDDLAAMTRAERAALPYMHTGRVDVIAAGALVWREVVTRVGLADAVASEHDILDGMALSMLVS